MSDYDASAIKILSADEASERFPYEHLGRVITKYPKTSPVAIQRLLEACLQSGEKWRNVEDRYLRHNMSTNVSSEFTECYLTAMRERRH